MSKLQWFVNEWFMHSAMEIKQLREMNGFPLERDNTTALMRFEMRL